MLILISGYPVTNVDFLVSSTAVANDFLLTYEYGTLDILLLS